MTGLDRRSVSNLGEYADAGQVGQIAVFLLKERDYILRKRVWWPTNLRELVECPFPFSYREICKLYIGETSHDTFRPRWSDFDHNGGKMNETM